MRTARGIGPRRRTTGPCRAAEVGQTVDGPRSLTAQATSETPPASPTLPARSSAAQPGSLRGVLDPPAEGFDLGAQAVGEVEVARDPGSLAPGEALPSRGVGGRGELRRAAWRDVAEALLAAQARIP